jgi:hypothetical protein
MLAGQSVPAVTDRLSALVLLVAHGPMLTALPVQLTDWHAVVCSPAYGTLSDYQFMRRHTSSDKRKEKARDAWGSSPSTLSDIIQVFVKYTSGAQ